MLLLPAKPSFNLLLPPPTIIYYQYFYCFIQIFTSSTKVSDLILLLSCSVPYQLCYCCQPNQALIGYSRHLLWFIISIFYGFPLIFNPGAKIPNLIPLHSCSVSYQLCYCCRPNQALTCYSRHLLSFIISIFLLFSTDIYPRWEDSKPHFLLSHSVPYQLCYCCRPNQALTCYSAAYYHLLSVFFTVFY